MPAKKKAGSQTSVLKEPCCLCCQPVSVGKDEAPFCAGACQKKLQRYCASVSECCYKAMSDSSTPVHSFFLTVDRYNMEECLECF